MAKGRISNRTVVALACKDSQDRVFLWDEALAGFGVAAYPNGKEEFLSFSTDKQVVRAAARLVILGA